jgi:ketosteroid isomerase-like protein
MRFLCSSKILLAFTLAVLATGLSFPQTAGDADVQQLQRLEQVWNQAHENGDADALDKLWADDLEVDVPHMAVMSKADALSFARSGRMKFLHYVTSDLRVRVYGDTAVVSGRLQRTRSMNGKEIRDDWRFTKVYVRQAQQWRVVSFHASEAAQSTGS